MRTEIVSRFTVSLAAMIGEASRSGTAVSEGPATSRESASHRALPMTDPKANENAPYFRNRRRDTSWSGAMVGLLQPIAPACEPLYHFITVPSRFPGPA